MTVFTWDTAKLFYRTIVQNLYAIYEILRSILNLEFDIKTLQKGKKFKAILGAVVLSMTALVFRLIIKGHYTTLWIWFGLAFGLGVIGVGFLLWIVDFYVSRRTALVLSAFVFALVVFYIFGLNLFMDFSIRRIVFASVYLGLLGFFSVLLYAVFMAANIVNVSFFKKLLLTRLAEKVLMFEALLITSAWLFVGWQYMVDGYFYNALNLGFLVVLFLTLGWFWIAVTFYFFRHWPIAISFGIVLAWGLGVVPVLLLLLGVSFIKVLIFALFSAYLVWETFELGDARTRPWAWGVLVGVYLGVVLFLIF